MLKTLRKKGVAKKVLWVVAIVVILSFGFFGTAYLLTDTNQGQFAGKIFGKKVSLDKFDKAFNDVRVQAIIRYGDKFNEVQQYLNLESETWDRLILLNEVKKKRIKISNDEVVKEIASYPFFNRDGQFDQLLYNDVLKYILKIRARDFEESVRDTLKFKKLFEEKTESVSISNDDVFNEFKKKNEKVQVTYALVNPSLFTKDVTVEPAEAEEYFEANQVSFISPPSINVKYFVIPFPSFDEKSDDEIELLKSETENKASSLFTELTPTNFDQLAEKNNYNLEETGYFSVEKPILTLGWPFASLRSMFELNVSELAQPFPTANGWAIARINDKKDSFVPEFEEVKDDVIQELKLQRARKLAAEKAKQYITQIKEKLSTSQLPNFGQVASDLGLEVTQTPSFTRGQYLPKIGISPEIEESAFALTKDNPTSEVVETPIGYIIMNLDEYFPVNIEEFEKGKQAIETQLLATKRNEVFNDFLTKLRLKANVLSNLQSP